MHKIKIFCLVEGKIIDELPDRASGTYIRIHNILDELRKFNDIKLISIPYKYNLEGDRFKDNWFQRRKNFIYSWIMPIISIFSILLTCPNYVYFSYPHAVSTNAKWTNKINYLTIKICKKLKIRTIMYSHDWVEQSEIQGQVKNPVLSEKLERNLVENSDLLLVAFTKYPDKETIILPGGLKESEFSHLKYKIVKNRFNISYTGSLQPGKGIDILVNAVEILHRKYPYIHLYLWGSLQKELDERTKNLIKNSKYITNEIVPRTQLFRNFSKIDVLAYTYNPNIDYWDKNHPTKFFEYIGSEIPFISTKCNGIKKIIGGRGLLFVDYSVDDFCKKLEYLLNNPDERLRLHKELCELKKENTWEKRAKTFHNLIIKDFTSNYYHKP